MGDTYDVKAHTTPQLHKEWEACQQACGDAMTAAEGQLAHTRSLAIEAELSLRDTGVWARSLPVLPPGFTSYEQLLGSWGEYKKRYLEAAHLLGQVVLAFDQEAGVAPVLDTEPLSLDDCIVAAGEWVGQEDLEEETFGKPAGHVPAVVVALCVDSNHEACYVDGLLKDSEYTIYAGCILNCIDSPGPALLQLAHVKVKGLGSGGWPATLADLQQYITEDE